MPIRMKLEVCYAALSACFICANASSQDINLKISQVSQSIIEKGNGNFCKINLIENDLLISTSSNSGDLVSYRWSPPNSGENSWFGHLSVKYNDKNVADLGSDSKIIWAENSTMKSAHWELTGNGARLVEIYENKNSSINSIIHIICSENSIYSYIDTGTNLIKSIVYPKLNFSSNDSNIVIPYDPFEVHFDKSSGLYGSIYADWSERSSSTQDNGIIAFNKIINGNRNIARGGMVISISKNISNVFPPQINSPSKYLEDLSGRVVVDVWHEGGFAQIASKMRYDGMIGLRKCLAIIHVWQRLGYDDGYPEQFPANTALGGDEGLRALVETSKALGCRVALHENYVDNYPDSGVFRYADIAQDPDGRFKKAWLNGRTGIQSYATSPDFFVDIARPQSTSIKKMYQTDAAFIDVNSSVFPWWRVDYSPNRNSPATFSSFVYNTAALYDLERGVYEGPVSGEGKWHFFWAGMVDAVEGQFDGRFSPDRSDIPLIVDFDLLKIHPFVSEHGMGYYERWYPDVSKFLGDRLLQNKYRMQEVAFGHQPFLGSKGFGNSNLVWLETRLIQPVAERYGSYKAKRILYHVGSRWLPLYSAVGRSDLKQVYIQYQNGLEVFANGGRAQIVFPEVVLPAGGWLSRGPNFLAYSGERQGVPVSYRESDGDVMAETYGNKVAMVDFGKIILSGSVDIKKYENGDGIIEVEPGRVVDNIMISKKYIGAPRFVTESCNGIKSVVPISENEKYWIMSDLKCREYSWKS